MHTTTNGPSFLTRTNLCLRSPGKDTFTQATPTIPPALLSCTYWTGTPTPFTCAVHPSCRHLSFETCTFRCSVRQHYSVGAPSKWCLVSATDVGLLPGAVLLISPFFMLRERDVLTLTTLFSAMVPLSASRTCCHPVVRQSDSSTLTGMEEARRRETIGVGHTPSLGAHAQLGRVCVCVCTRVHVHIYLNTHLTLISWGFHTHRIALQCQTNTHTTITK